MKNGTGDAWHLPFFSKRLEKFIKIWYDQKKIQGEITMELQKDTGDHFSWVMPEGGGETEVFQVFPGIYLMYNDFHVHQCRSGLAAPSHFWGVDHCRRGRTEWELPGGHRAYLGEGALITSDFQRSGGDFSFPMGLYEGLTVCLDEDRAPEGLPPELKLSLNDLREKLFSAGIMDLSGDPEAEAILTLLYLARGQGELQRKMGLTLFLSYLNALEPRQLEPLYLRQEQVEEMGKIQAFLLENPHHRWTLAELSEKFQVPVSVLRRNFMGIYGLSVADYMRKIRAEYAGEMLKNSDQSVGEIAASLGYDNASKFSAAFRRCLGQSPRSYRSRNK